MQSKKRLSFRTAPILTFLGLVLPLLAAGYLFQSASEVRKPIIIKDVRVFDGEKVLTRTTVVVEGGKIAAVGEKISIPPDAEVIAGEGKTLLPGLIDAHVHVWDGAQLRQSLVFGVTAVIDMFTTNLRALKDGQKAQVESGDAGLAYLISPGNCVTAPGGHGTQFGPGIPTITGPERAQEFVDARIAEGSDFIKIMLDDGSVYGMPRPTISNETMAAVIRATHQRNKLAVIHAATLQNCEDALNAGVDGLAHLYFNDAHDPNFGRLVAQKGAFVIPTFSVLQTLAGMSEAAVLASDVFISPYLKPFDIQNLERSYPFKGKEANYGAAERALRQLKEAGVPILAGTDAPNPGTTFGASLHRELELLIRAELTPIEALRAATSVPAARFNLEGHGRIQPGMTADLVLVSGDPTRDIKATRDIVSIWKGGRLVDREKYREEAAAEKAAPSSQAPIPEYGDSGLISDFEGESIEAKFGAGWMISTFNRGNLGAAYLYARRYEEAIAAWRGGLIIEPESAFTRNMLAVTYALNKMPDDAVAEAEKSISSLSAFEKGLPHLNVALVYALVGRRDDALKLLNECLASRKGKPIDTATIVEIYSALGEIEEAFKWLEKTYQDHVGTICWLKVDPILDNLRSDPRFKEYLRKAGFEK